MRRRPALALFDWPTLQQAVANPHYYRGRLLWLAIKRFKIHFLDTLCEHKTKLAYLTTVCGVNYYRHRHRLSYHHARSLL